MSVPEFPSNSYNQRERKKLDPVVSGRVSVHKDGVAGKLIRFGVKTACEKVLSNVVAPTLKDLFVETVSELVANIVYGGASSARPPQNNRGYIDYSSTSRRHTKPLHDHHEQNSSYRNVKFDKREDALRVLETLRCVLEDYGWATVSDFNELTGITGQYTDHKWGWSDLDDVDIRYVRQKYVLVMPPPEPVK